MSTTIPIQILILIFALTCSTSVEVHQFSMGSNHDLKVDLNVGSFAIKDLGTEKMKNQVTAESIVKIVWMFDIIFIQGMMEMRNDAFQQLFDMVNRSDKPYEKIITERLGRYDEQEQFAYFYRKDKLQIIDTRLFDDCRNDFFAKEPFSVLVQPTGKTIDDRFAVMGLRTDPENTVSELNVLTRTAIKDIQEAWNIEDILLTGDFSADCEYTDLAQLFPVPFFNTPSSYQWLIGLEADTTTSPETHCGYDRIMVMGDRLKGAVQNDAKDDELVLRFDETLGLTESQMLAVSDHYPVRVTLTL